MDTPLQAATTFTAPEPGAPNASSLAPSNDNDVGAGLDVLSKEFEKLNAAPAQQTQPTPSAPPPEPTIPPPPPLIPGAYSPEQEQASLRAAEAISNPSERLRLQGVLKREYANQKLADGVTRQAREDAKNKSVADYSKAAHELLMDDKTDWAKKLVIMKRLNEVMWQDPRLDVGDAKELLQNHIVNIVGAPNEGKLGRGYQTAQDGVVNRTITSNEQILRMERNGDLTHEGATWTMQSLKELDAPKGPLNTARTEFFKRYAATIDPSGQFGEHTVLGAQRIYLAERAARSREALLEKAGRNPDDVYNPDSKDFFGTPENMSRYTTTLKEATDYAAKLSKTGVGVPPPLRDETATSIPATSTGAPAPAPTPVDTRGMTREQILLKLKPGTPVILPDGRRGVVPYPTIPMSR